jgi:hypothetical protein
MKEIREDGSVVGETFSPKTYTGGYPVPCKDDTYKSYRERVNKVKKEGFHLGDLSWEDWRAYCIGAGYDDEISHHDYIFE